VRADRTETVPGRFMTCRDSGLWWFPDYEAAACQDHRHAHELHVVERHRHRSVVLLPDGTAVTAVSFHPEAPYVRDRVPDYGFYLDPRWKPPWPHELLDWPDFGVPEVAPLRIALRSLLERSRSGEVVELGCVGAHGRTGTALACLSVLTGAEAGQSVDWVRAVHCEKAVETAEQETFARHFRPC
jgi:protein-tyrosine phosphatase